MTTVSTSIPVVSIVLGHLSHRGEYRAAPGVGSVVARMAAIRATTGTGTACDACTLTSDHDDARWCVCGAPCDAHDHDAPLVDGPDGYPIGWTVLTTDAPSPY